MSARDDRAVELAKQTIWRLRALRFHPYLDNQGAFLIADTAGRKRSVSEYLPITAVFDDLVAGLADDPGLLDPYEDPSARGGGGARGMQAKSEL